jgi:hypothetical protein
MTLSLSHLLLKALEILLTPGDGPPWPVSGLFHGSDMKIKDVVEVNYANVFEGQSDGDKRAQIKAIQYVLSIAAQMKVDIGEWDLFEVFGNGVQGHIYVMKSSLNERFFKKLESVPKAQPAVALTGKAFELTPEVLKDIQVYYDSRRKSLLDEAKSYAEGAMRNVRSYQSQLDRYLKQYAAHAHQVIMLEGNSQVSLPQEIASIEQAGFWEFINYRKMDTALEFKTKNPVHASKVNPAAGIDIHVNFGLFKAVVFLKSSQVYVEPCGNNLKVSGYAHPHVSDGGSVCWGNAADMVARSLPLLKIAPVMEALSIILTHYNEDSPFQHIEGFYKVAMGDTKPTWYCEACDEDFIEGESCHCDRGSCTVCGVSENGFGEAMCHCCMDCENTEHECDCEDVGEDDASTPDLSDGSSEPAPDSVSEAAQAIAARHTARRIAEEVYGRSPAMDALEDAPRGPTAAEVYQRRREYEQLREEDNRRRQEMLRNQFNPQVLARPSREPSGEWQWIDMPYVDGSALPPESLTFSAAQVSAESAELPEESRVAQRE